MLWFGTDTANAAPKNRKSPKKADVETLSTRDEALRQLSGIPTQADHATPSVMLPLKAEYNPIARRAWDWIFEAELAQRKITVPRPPGAVGPNSTGELPAFQFFGLGAGLEKSFTLRAQKLRVGLMGHGAISVATHNVTLQNALPLKARYQWIGYGFEPRVTWNFQPRWSLLLGTGFDQVTMIQSSADSELAAWTQAYNERSNRLAVQFGIDDHQFLSLAGRQVSNAFESPTVYSFLWGARW